MTNTTPADRIADALAPVDLVPHYDDGNAETALELWTVETDDGATWAARKLGRVNERLAEILALYEVQQARLDAWRARETEALEKDQRFFAGRLEGYHRARLADDPRALTIRLPDGTILKSAAGRLAVEIDDLDALARWAEEQERSGLLDLGDPKPNKNAIADAFAAKAAQETDPGMYPAVDPETGETVPGVRIERRPRGFTISTPTKDD